MKTDRRQPTISAHPNSPEAVMLRKALCHPRSDWVAPYREASQHLLGVAPRGKQFTHRKKLASCSDNLLGIAITEKRSAGKYVSEPAITLLVRRKIPLSKLTRAQRLPRTINGYTTDVVSIGTPRFAQGPVVRAGDAINIAGRHPGTLGAFLHDGAGQRYAITNGHVVGGTLGATAYSPPFGTAEATPIGLVQHAAAPVPGTINALDLALVALEQTVEINPLLPTIGSVSGLTAPDPAQLVRMNGHSSPNAFGWFFASRANLSLPIDGFTYGFREVQIFWAQGNGTFGAQGDSGSIIVDDNSQAAIGQLFAVSSGFAYAIPMERIFKGLQGWSFL